MLPFIFDGRQHPVSYVLTFRIIEHLDVIENILSRFDARFVNLAPDPFALEEVEKAFNDSVIMAIASTADRMFKIVRFQE